MRFQGKKKETHLETIDFVHLGSIIGCCESERLDTYLSYVQLCLGCQTWPERAELALNLEGQYPDTQMRRGIQLGTAINEPPSAETSHSEWDLTWFWVSLNVFFFFFSPYVLKDSKKETA